jgi:hypothetical protein
MTTAIIYLLVGAEPDDPVELDEPDDPDDPPL